jgi:hypothetical protein
MATAAPPTVVKPLLPVQDPVPSDIDIAQSIQPKHISQIAEVALGLQPQEYQLYGPTKAKVRVGWVCVCVGCACGWVEGLIECSALVMQPASDGAASWWRHSSPWGACMHWQAAADEGGSCVQRQPSVTGAYPPTRLCWMLAGMRPTHNNRCSWRCEIGSRTRPTANTVRVVACRQTAASRLKGGWQDQTRGVPLQTHSGRVHAQSSKRCSPQHTPPARLPTSAFTHTCLQSWLAASPPHPSVRARARRPWDCARRWEHTSTKRWAVVPGRCWARTKGLPGFTMCRSSAHLSSFPGQRVSSIAAGCTEHTGADVHPPAQPGPHVWHQGRSSRRRLQPGESGQPVFARVAWTSTVSVPHSAVTGTLPPTHSPIEPATACINTRNSLNCHRHH